jgi:DNA polymerase-3 subunit alpha
MMIWKLIEHQDYLVKPDGFNIPYDAERIHGISTELAAEKESLCGRFG